jgi:type IV secretion system protein VirD4
MSARTSILMVKSSRSFELTKIRHYRDKPYSRFFEASKGSAPALPTLQEWVDENFGGVINPASVAKESNEAVAVAPELESAAHIPSAVRKTSVRKSPPKKAKRPKVAPEAVPDPVLLLQTRTRTKKATNEKPRERLSLGTAPSAPQGENCDLRNVIAASLAEQTRSFDSMVASIDSTMRKSSEPLEEAFSVLARLQNRFGDDAA